MNLLDLMIKVGIEDETAKGIDSVAQNVKGKLGTAAKVAAGAVAAGTAAAAAGAAAIGKAALDSYASFEQLEGGVAKLYGNAGQSLEEYAESMGKTSDEVRETWEANQKAQEQVMKDAQEAYKTAGMSANDYMETATSFSAALVSSLGGDTQKAAELTKTAMVSMSDNVNTFGSDFESVQNAFQGFAKQNYTMLDNLKLGYGGTKEEMQRLIDDANEYAASMGQASDLSIESFADIVTAIDLVQQKTQIAGTTQREAMGTIEGSINMTKSAWTNFVAELGKEDGDLGARLDEVIEGAMAVIDNVAPRIVTIAENIGAAIPQIADKLAPKIQELVSKAGDYLQENGPTMIQGALDLFSNMAKGAAQAIPQVTKGLRDLLLTIVDNIPTYLPQIIEAAITLFGGLLEGLSDIVGGVLLAIGELITMALAAITDAANDGAMAAAKFVAGIVKGIADKASSFVSSVEDFLKKGIKKIGDFVSNAKNAAIDFMKGIINGITSKAGEVVSGIGSMVTNMVNKVKEIPGKVKSAVSGAVGWLKETGRNIVQGLINGISGMFGNVKDMVSRLAHLIPEPIRKVLNIGSPSKLMKQYGEWTVEGLAIGLEDKAGTIQKAMGSLANTIADTDLTAEASLGYSTSKYFQNGSAQAVGDTYNITLQLGANADANQIVLAIADALESKNRLAGHATVTRNVRYA